ncbi:MAG: molybdopterin-dependent oxidoreductase [Stomatobaculum sp.]|nr:molybdopterin-dependent oxidoreductase [Stomatobaculum sp.]
MRVVNTPVRKKDAMQLLTGQPVYLEDMVPKGYLVVKILRSPHAHALIEEIDTSAAMKVPGIEAVFTWKDVPQDMPRHTQAGQTFPEFSPCDRLVLDRRVRFAGDVAAIVAGADEKCVDRAMKLIKVKYQVLTPVLDMHQAKDAEILVHPEENWRAQVPCGADNRRNLCASETTGEGDVDRVLSECDVVVEHTFHTKAVQQAMMETFRTYCSIDPVTGRLNVISSTQILFHCRRIIADALGIPKSMVRVMKPRIGGGFGAKQTAVSETYPAFVTWKTKKPSMIIFSREESQTASSPRHEMEVKVRVGGMKNGKLRAIDLYTLSNAGAYGEHSPTTVSLSGHKSIPLYRELDAFRFSFDVVYTNVMSAGAFRGYGAPQGIFAVETCVTEFAEKVGLDPMQVREMNMVREGDRMPAYDGSINTSCTLDLCLKKVREMIRWDEKYPVRTMPDGKLRAVGIGLAMQGSGIAGVDTGSAALSLNDDGFYILRIGAADMGTGCDTTLAQIAAEVLECSPDRVVTAGADTDTSPYDKGSYASSTAYVTGKAVERCARKLRDRILTLGAELLGVKKEESRFDGERVYVAASGAGQNTDDAAGVRSVSLADISQKNMFFNNLILETVEMNTSPFSPPPFMAGAAEVEIDPETGETRVVEYDACVDCGTPLNPNLTRVQAEGGILQGIGMTLMENVTYNKNGVPYENSFMQYKIPSRQDVGRIRVEFAPSYEPSGPFGAKSIGEVVLNTPLPAIAEAVYHATGVRFTELPITPEMVAKALRDKKKQ